MHQSDGIHAGLHPNGAWMQVPGERRTADLPEETQSMVQENRDGLQIFRSATMLTGRTDRVSSGGMSRGLLKKYSGSRTGVLRGSD